MTTKEAISRGKTLLRRDLYILLVIQEEMNSSDALFEKRFEFTAKPQQP